MRPAAALRLGRRGALPAGGQGFNYRQALPVVAAGLLALAGTGRAAGLAAMGGGSGAPAPASAARHVGERNVLGGQLELCGTEPRTGFFRDGYCCTGTEDRGVHVVCAQVTAGFLEYTKGRGNDLSSPAPMYGFPGLRPGDRWCLCASRWAEAERAGHAPRVFLEATHSAALSIVDLETLQKYAVQPESGEM